MPSTSTVIYTIPPEDYFWHWSSDDSSIEWADGSTLALREEIITILENLAENGGIPPLGSLLLVIASCNGDAPKAIKAFQNCFPLSERENPSSVASQFSSGIEQALTVISQLPKELRYGLRAKTQLCQALFSRSVVSHQTEAAKKIIFELIAETPSQWEDECPYYLKEQRLLRDGKTILNCCAGLSNIELTNLIETGIEFKHLSAAELDQPKLSSSDENRPLLDRLQEAEPELQGIAKLARKVISFISIARPAMKEQELRIGGVADIINRGTPDRLLCSELAWDDLSLAVRLANNEALYYRRETSPDNASAERILLLDHGLRYWGLLRLYSHAILLALASVSKKHKKLATHCYCTVQNGYSTLEISAVKDVKKALAKLPAHLDPTAALQSLYQDLLLNPPEGIPDLFFILTRDSIEEIQAKNSLSQLALLIRKYGGHCYLVFIATNGDISYEEHLGGQIKRLQEGHIELDDLFPQEPLVPNEEPAEIPKETPSQLLRKQDLETATKTSFYNLYPPPLLFWSRPKGIIDALKEPSGGNFLSVDWNERLIRWFESDAPVEEVASRLPGQRQWPYIDDAGNIYVACSASKPGESVKVLKILSDGSYEEIPICKSKHSFPTRVSFTNSAIIISYTNDSEALSLDTGKLVASVAHNGQNLSERTFRLIDDKLTVSSKKRPEPEALAFFNSKSKKSDDSQKTIKPDQIAIASNGRIILFTEEEIFFFSAMRWTKIGSHPITEGAAFTDLSIKHAEGEPNLQQAQLGSITATLDPRHILHLSNGEEAFSISLYQGDTSVWNEFYGTVSHSAVWIDFNPDGYGDADTVEAKLVEMLTTGNDSTFAI